MDHGLMGRVGMAGFAGALAAGLMAGPALAAGAAPAPCLRQDMVRGWNAPNDRTLLVTDLQGYKFKLSLAGACHDLRFQFRLAFHTYGASRLSCVRRNDWLVVPAQAYQPSARCLITAIDLVAAPAIPPQAGAQHH